MFKKLLQGFLFGIGFTLAVILVVWIVSISNLSFTTQSTTSSSEEKVTYEDEAKWRTLPFPDKISKTSGLVLLRFKVGEEKHMEAYVERVLLKDSSINLPLSVGDRVEKSDYYATEGHSSNRNGVLLIYTGNPAKRIEGAYLYNDRLISHGDMPLELFLRKFNEESSN